MKGIISSDKLFTIPGVVVITIGGFSAAIYGGIPILKTGWIFLVTCFIYPFWPHIFLEAGAITKKNISTY
jgi:hypothetical protein